MVGTLSSGTQKIIPLVGTGNFTTVEVDWFTSDDIGGSAGGSAVNVDLQNPTTSPLPLLAQSSWKANRPSLLQVQLMQFGSNGFKLSDFDDTTNSQSDANTLFLYATGTTDSNPQNYAPAADAFIQRDIRQTPTGSPLRANCLGTLAGGGYACSELLTLPTPIGGGCPTAYLRLMPFYNATHFRVKLHATNSLTSTVQFRAVQPLIDSTGRADDLFSRVETRVDLLNDSFPYPADAVDITGNFCKNFAVTNNTADYTAINSGNTCSP